MKEKGIITIVKPRNDNQLLNLNFSHGAILTEQDMMTVRGGKFLKPICRNLCTGCLIRIGCSGRMGSVQDPVELPEELPDNSELMV